MRFDMRRERALFERWRKVDLSTGLAGRSWKRRRILATRGTRTLRCGSGAVLGEQVSLRDATTARGAACASVHIFAVLRFLAGRRRV